MDLDWSKQIYMINKLIMDWKWKSLAAKADSAQLRGSYVEYLFPRLEIGLLYADIDQQTCQVWMRSIIHTLCISSGFSDYSLNTAGFCLLADIPDIWLRAQTARATELICSLNSRNSAVGSSTLARFCASMKSLMLLRQLELSRKRKI